MDDQNDTDAVAIAAIKQRAANFAHVLDMQGLVALLARVLYDISVLESMVNETGFPSFTEDQIFAIILSGMPVVEHVELGSSSSLTDGGKAGPSSQHSLTLEE